MTNDAPADDLDFDVPARNLIENNYAISFESCFLRWQLRSMGTLAFLDDRRLFDGDCVRFNGVDSGATIVCGVTTYALKCCDSSLPHYGLLPAEAFISAYEKSITDIHHVARTKYEKGEFEPEGPIQIMVHSKDIAP